MKMTPEENQNYIRSVIQKYADLEKENARLLAANRWESDIAEQALQEIARFRAIQPTLWFNETTSSFTHEIEIFDDWLANGNTAYPLYKETKIE